MFLFCLQVLDIKNRKIVLGLLITERFIFKFGLQNIFACFFFFFFFCTLSTLFLFKVFIYFYFLSLLHNLNRDFKHTTHARARTYTRIYTYTNSLSLNSSFRRKTLITSGLILYLISK